MNLLKKVLSTTTDYEGVTFTKKQWKQLKINASQWEDRDSIESEINLMLKKIGYVYHTPSCTWTKFQLNASSMVEWLYSDLDRADLRCEVNKIVSALQSTGTFKVTPKSLFKGLGYVPTHLCENMEDFEISEFEYLDCDDDDDLEFSPENCFLFNDLK